MKNEQIKIALLAFIGFTLAIQTYYTINNSGPSYRTTQLDAAEPASNMVANNPMAVNPTNSIVPEMPTAATPVVNNGPKTTINFAQMEHDFGAIKQETENKKVFKFTNTGTEPLIISNAVGSCGCTVPTFPKEPIAPGKTGEIEVVYKPGSQKGSQTKTVTVTANTEPEQTVVYIKADVQEI